MQVGIDAQNVGQRHRVRALGLRTCRRVTFPVAGCRQRVDRIHRSTGNEEHLIGERAELLTECLPEAGEGRCAARRVLHHPPVSEPVEVLRLGPGSASGAAADLIGADVGILAGQQ